MTSTPPPAPETPNPPPGVNPLGGRVHDRTSATPSRRRWAGFSAYVRTCPECAWENDEHALFCVACAADLRHVAPGTSRNPAPGAALIQRRLAREQRRQRRIRSGDTPGGGGWIAVAMAVVVGTLVTNPDPAIWALAWLVAVVLALTGLWQLRYDTKSLRMWGGVLASSAAILLLVVGFRAIQASERFSGGGEQDTGVTPTATVAHVVHATPDQPSLSGSVPMYQGSATHDGVMPGPVPGAAPSLAWQADTGGELYAAPALAEGLLYVSSKSGTLHAYNAATGEPIWSTELTTYVTRGTPAVVDGVIYVGGGFTFQALDARSGELVWETALQYGGQSSPTVTENLVIATSQQGWLYALARDTGELAWRIPTEGLAFGSTAVSGEHVVYGTDEGIIYNAKLESGRLTWRTTVPGAVFATPVISGDAVYVTTKSGELYALDLATGQQRWKASHGSNEPPAVSGDLVVVAAADGGVYGLDAATGAQRWLFPSGRESLTAPVIAGDTVLVGAGSSLYAIDAGTGAARWYFLAGDVIESPPVVADGFVFFGGRDGFLYAVSDR